MVTPPDATVMAIARQLAAVYRPERMILFGSRTRGQAHADSDIDLLIVKDTTQPFYQRLAEVRRLVSAVRQGRAFEPVVLTPRELRERLALGDQFLQEIMTSGTVLHG